MTLIMYEKLPAGETDTARRQMASWWLMSHGTFPASGLRRAGWPSLSISVIALRDYRFNLTTLAHGEAASSYLLHRDVAEPAEPCTPVKGSQW
jgi:hypothetical protein